MPTFELLLNVPRSQAAALWCGYLIRLRRRFSVCPSYHGPRHRPCLLRRNLPAASLPLLPVPPEAAAAKDRLLARPCCDQRCVSMGTRGAGPLHHPHVSACSRSECSLCICKNDTTTTITASTRHGTFRRPSSIPPHRRTTYFQVMRASSTAICRSSSSMRTKRSTSIILGSLTSQDWAHGFSCSCSAATFSTHCCAARRFCALSS